MREVEKLANEKFGGDIHKAIDYAYRTWGNPKNEEEREKMLKIYNSLNKEELRYTGDVIRNLAIERSGRAKVEEFEQSVRYMKSLNMSDDEILNTPNNPYSKNVWLGIIALLLAIILPIVAERHSTTDWNDLRIILVVLVSIFLVPNLLKFFEFKEAKKLILKMAEHKDK